MSTQPTAIPPLPTKRRLGCFWSLVAFFVLGSLVVLALTAALTPWGFYLGGHFHWFPMWQGWGRMHSASAGDYVLFVRMSPSRRGQGRHASVSGTAELCTPRGEHFTLRLGGSMNKGGWFTNTDGEPLHIYMSRRTWFLGGTETRPHLDLYGLWHNPDLLMEDRGALSRAFLPDGSLNTGTSRNQPYAREVVQVTLREGSKSDFESACSAAKR